MPKSRVRKRARGSGARAPRPKASSWVASRGFTLPLISFPADLIGANAPEFASVHVDVVMADSEAVERLRLPLWLTRRLVGPGRFDLWGNDAAGAFSVHLSGRPNGPWTLGAHVSGDELDGHQMREILRVLRAFTSARQVALVPAGASPTSWSELPHAALSEPIPGELERVVEAHAYLEDALNVRVKAPIAYTAADVQDTFETAALLRGESVKQTWTSLDWPMAAREADLVLADLFVDDGQARLELQREWIWTVGSTETRVGTVDLVYSSVRVARQATSPANPETTVLTLEPGTDPSLLVRLVSVAESISVDRALDQQWFWAPNWQAREREVDEHVATGRITVHDDAEQLFAAFDEQPVRLDE